MSGRIDRALVLEAFRKALLQRPGAGGFVDHSDRGSRHTRHESRTQGLGHDVGEAVRPARFPAGVCTSCTVGQTQDALIARFADLRRASQILLRMAAIG